ncbi:Phosphoribosylglycinamide formyltransferase [hydrothermal vent metagenome]|uniref:phosphoribosylglycinamide formyltransferase 1 n=1 Tax=hydrothermal vent metagenome TaxID=652676 RepID=A0A3B0WPZ1_9ZZZZ
MKQPIRIAVLISGSGSNLQAIIDHQKRHSHEYKIALVISNKANAYGLTRAKNANISTQVIEHSQFKSRETFDKALQKTIDDTQIDLIVLAGFMRILTPAFTQHFLGKMINIHPSLLPKYTGLNTHQRALDAGDTEHGLSIHFVTPELDSGPVILQAKVSITPQDTEETLKEKVHQQEYLAYPLVIEWFAQAKLEFKDHQTWFKQTLLSKPQQLHHLNDLVI